MLGGHGFCRQKAKQVEDDLIFHTKIIPILGRTKYNGADACEWVPPRRSMWSSGNLETKNLLDFLTPWPTSIHLWHSLAFPCPPCLSDFNLSWSVLNSPHIFMFSQMIWNGCKIVGFEWKRRHLWWRKQREEFINFSTFPCVDNFSLYRVMKIGMLLIWFPRTQPICCWMSDLDQFACLCRTQEWHTTRAD